VLVVKARVDKREDTPKLIAMDVEVFEGGGEDAAPLRVRVAPQRVDERCISELKLLLERFPGESPVYLHLGEQVLRLPDDFCVDRDSGVIAELRVLFGPAAIL
jgi:DNA polymerase-3 subunit alpha